MPIHRGPRLDDFISRAVGVIPIQANIYRSWPELASPLLITPGASGWGSWYQLIAAASAPTVPFTITHLVILGAQANNNPLEIGVGGAGSEVSVASVCSPSGYNLCSVVHSVHPLPIIAGGSRVAVRWYNNGGGNAAQYVYGISCILPTRPSIERISRELRKYGTFYPGVVGFNQKYPDGVNAPADSNYTWGTWKEQWASTYESSPTILTQLIWGAAGGGNVYGFLGMGYGGTDGASNSPTAQFMEIASYPDGSGNGAWAMDLPIAILVPGSTRITARAAGSAVTLNLARPQFTALKGSTYL